MSLVKWLISYWTMYLMFIFLYFLLVPEGRNIYVSSLVFMLSAIVSIRYAIWIDD